MLAAVLLLASCQGCQKPTVPERKLTATASAAPGTAKPVSVSSETDREDPESYTNVLIHNVIIHTPQRTRMRVKWMRARMYPLKPGVPASFDDMKSFRLEITEGLMGMNVADLSNLLNGPAVKGSLLRHVRIEAAGEQLRITGTLKKIVPLPVQLLADVSASPDHSKVRLRATKISFLKIPMKGLLGALHLHASDFVNNRPGGAIHVDGDTIDIDMDRLLPEPKTHGPLTEVRVWKTGELMEYYGKAREDAIQVKEWRNFLRMRGGTISFGKLTMHNSDLLLVDTSMADWLNFDVLHYQEQLVNGETHITPSAGLQIFIPDINKIPASERNRDISLQWMKNRNLTPPAEAQSP